MLLYKIIIKTSYGHTLNSFVSLFTNIFKEVVSVTLPKKTKKFVVLRSPHIYKKAMEHFESRQSTKIFLTSIPRLHEELFKKKLKAISWSFFGISIKLIRLEKQSFYLKQKDSNL